MQRCLSIRLPQAGSRSSEYFRGSLGCKLGLEKRRMDLATRLVRTILIRSFDAGFFRFPARGAHRVGAQILPNQGQARASWADSLVDFARLLIRQTWALLSKFAYTRRRQPVDAALPLLNEGYRKVTRLRINIHRQSSRLVGNQ